MPHFKNGQEAKRFDRVKFMNGTRYFDDPETTERKSEPVFAEGIIIDIVPGAQSCELLVGCGSLKLMGSVNLPQFCGDTQSPRAGIVLDGYWTHANAADCELVES